MPDANPRPKPQQIIASESTFNIYANNTEVGITPWDVRFRFREILDSDDNQARVKDHGSVVMSPGHAKALLFALQSSLSMYEDRFGEIDISKITAAVKQQTTPEKK